MENFSLEPYEWNDEYVRWTVMDLLKVMNQSTLASLCPLPQPMISNIVNSKYPSVLSNDKLRAFGTWYKSYKVSQHYNMLQKQAQSQDTCNVRVTFHPKIEVPRLKAWFHEHPLPSDNLLTTFVTDLNNSLVRLERPKIQIKHLKLWWTNQRQKLKREEREKRLHSLNLSENRPENSGKLKSGMTGTLRKIKSQSEKEQSTNVHQKVDNQRVRSIQGQGIVREINVPQTHPGDNYDDRNSKVRKTVSGHLNRNTAFRSNEYVPVTDVHYYRVDQETVNACNYIDM